MAIDPSVLTTTDNSGAPTAPAPQPTTQPVAPDVAATNAPPTAPTTPMPVAPAQTAPAPPPKSTFGESFARGMQGPKYEVTGTGETINAAPDRAASRGGILGGALSGILRGALEGLQAPTDPNGRGRGSALASGARYASEQDKQRDATARAQAQKDFQQRQDATEAKLRANLIAAQTHDLVQKSQHEDIEFPERMKGIGIENDEHQVALQNALEQRRQVHADLTQTLIAHGLNPYATVSQTPVDGKGIAAQAQPHIGSVVAGKAIPVQSGGVGSQNGVSLFSSDDLSQPVSGNPKDQSSWIAIPYFDGTKDNDGKFMQKTKYIAPDGKISYGDVARQFMAADNQLDVLMKKDAAVMGAQQKKADLANTQAETGLRKGQTNEANQKAGLAAQQTKNLQGGGAKNDDGTWNPASIPVGIVEGTMDPSQLSKRSADYNQKLQAASQYSLEKYGKPFDIAQATIDYKYATNVQTQNTLKYLNSVTPNMQDLVRQSDAIKRTSLPPLNNAEAWARLNTGDPAMAAYNATLTEVSDQIAKILQGGGSGSGTSDAKLKQAQDLFNSKFSPQQVKSTVDELSRLLDTRKAALIGGNRYLQKQFGAVQTQGGPQQPPANQAPSSATAKQNPY